MNYIRLAVMVFVSGSAFTVGLRSATGAELIQFNRDVRPILSNHCFTCHGPDSATREAGLRLDQRDNAIAESDSGERAIVPGKLNLSELIRRVTSKDDDVRMPPVDGHEPLNKEQIETLKEWIKQGAEYQQHWSFVAVERSSPPALTAEDRVSKMSDHPVDRFVRSRLKAEGLKPAPRATPETLIRRVAFDLTGLPPTIEEIDAFLADKKPQAYERMVDRYLASPAYGEHMARHWLDLARYADSNGYQYDTERSQWVWRDWVINAYNENMPFDQFTVEQLAGDLLPNATPSQRLATGFNRNHGVTIEGGVVDEEYRSEYVMDRVVTTGSVWMGLTIGCARCHDHKFDPISQKEFYQFYAYFNQVPERGLRGFDPQEKIPSPLASATLKQQNDQVAKLKAKLAEPLDVDAALEKWVKTIVAKPSPGWLTLEPTTMKSSGGSTATKLDDQSIVFGGANPQKDNYDIRATTELKGISAVRLEALTHESLPGNGPGRHSNSNFVLSEFEATAVSVKDPSKTQAVKFVKAFADYQQANYEVAKAIDGNSGNSGWAVDGPTRKENATAVFVAKEPFGFDGGTELRFLLRHEASFATHGIGRPRFSITTADSSSISLEGFPEEIRLIALKAVAKRTPKESAQIKAFFLEHFHPLQATKDQIKSLEQQTASAFPTTMIMKDRPNLRATHILTRGQYNEPAAAVSMGVPAVFPAVKENTPANRLGMAQWLVDPQHPLTARVAVNRYWHRLFGVGIVKTSEDFGVQGELPSHPKLLDWLAQEFINTGWDVKRMQRLLLTSATYQQTSHVGEKAYAFDPENRLLARGPRFRLDGEEIRDAALSVSGQLVSQIGGRSVYPYQPEGLWLELNNRPGLSKAYPQGKNNDLYRRSMYTFWKRTVPSPMMKTFDAPEREFCTIRRSRTNTPLQALLLLNAPQYVEASRHLGERMLIDGGSDAGERLTFGFRLVTARKPNDMELSLLRDVYHSELKRFQANESASEQVLGVGDSPANVGLNRAELAAMATVARLILNLNEAITKG